MTPDQQIVLDALYQVEAPRLQRSQYDGWVTAADVAARLPLGDPHCGDESWTRSILNELWRGRKVLQIPEVGAQYELQEVWLRGTDAYGATDSRIPGERNDCRGGEPEDW